MSISDVGSPRLLRLALADAAPTALRIWFAASPNVRERAALAFLDVGGGPARKSPIRAIAIQRHFRPQTVAGWSDEKLAAAVARIDFRDGDWVWPALVEYHAAYHSEMLAGFLDSVGIPHEGGRVASADVPVKAIPASTIISAADVLVARYALEDVVLYLLALWTMEETTFQHVADWFRLRLKSDSLALSPVLPAQPAQPDPKASTYEIVGFTKLDLRLTRIVVDAVAEITGAPTREEVDDILSELEKLSSSRHQTFFHCGFRDALFGREPATVLAADNASRRRWYFSGYISGLARFGDFSVIARLFDEKPALREISDAADGASASATWLVFRALCDQGRFAEAASMAPASVAALSSELRQAMLATATDLIRQSRAADARQLLDTLRSILSDEPHDDEAAFGLSVMRRWALCQRQLGNAEEAKTVLEALTLSTDTVTRAVALTDLGLISVGVRRLGELTLPRSEQERSTFIESLERGEDLFRQAVQSSSFQPAHAQFALGVLELMRANYCEATKRLDSALTFFATTPEVYRADGTLALAELYLGIALCQSMEDSGRLMRASELIQAGLAGGAKVPHWLVRSTIDTLSLGRSDLVDAPATALLASDSTALDELLQSAAGGSTLALTSALFARAALPTKPVPDRVRDYRRVIPLLLRDGDVGRATDGLEFLEEQAAEGIGTTELTAFLEEPSNYSPAWTPERAAEARARLFESEGRFGEAASVLERLVYRILSQGEDHAVDRAELIVGHLESYGVDFRSLVARLSSVIEGNRAAAESDDSGDDLPSDLDYRILVVGGDELQARMEEGVVRRVQEKYPKLSIEFLHTGWSGNWIKYAEDFDRRVKKVDGVVLLALMRTNLGVTVRQSCPVPWRGCRGKGQGQIAEAIERLLPFIAHQKERDRAEVLAR